MGIGYRPAIFLSVRGILKPLDTKPISYEEYSKRRDHSYSWIENVQRAILPFDYLEIEVDIMGKKDIINLTELDKIRRFIQVGDQVFLREKNEMAFLDLCDKINDLKEKVLILSRSESKNHSENIKLLSNTNHDYKEFRHKFVEWFISKHIAVPIIPEQNNSLEIAPEKIMTGIQSASKVEIFCFDTLELIIPKSIEPRIKVAFRLEGKSHQTNLLKLDQVPYSYLMYLAMERKENGKMWMLHPENHINELHEIYNQLELPINYATEFLNELPSRINWFNDHRNKYRKTINSEINAIVRKEGCIKGSLLYNLGKVSPSRNGVYTLAKSIQNIK